MAYPEQPRWVRNNPQWEVDRRPTSQELDRLAETFSLQCPNTRARAKAAVVDFDNADFHYERGPSVRRQALQTMCHIHDKSLNPDIYTLPQARLFAEGHCDTEIAQAAQIPGRNISAVGGDENVDTSFNSESELDSPAILEKDIPDFGRLL
jgi:hypothetical protein